MFPTACINEATSVDVTDQTDPESLSRAIYAARSHLALTPPDASAALAVIEPALSSDEPTSSARAIKAFAEYLQSEDKPSQVEELRDLVLEFDAEEVNEETIEDERIVRVMAGTAFILEKEVEEAVTTLSEGCGKTDLEWYVNIMLEPKGNGSYLATL
jgi:coatomer protein complex subunit epsilon